MQGGRECRGKEKAERKRKQEGKESLSVKMAQSRWLENKCALCTSYCSGSDELLSRFRCR